MFNYMIMIRNDLIFTPQSLLEKLQRDNLQTKLAVNRFVIKQNKDVLNIENGTYSFYLSLCNEYIQEEFQGALEYCQNKDYAGNNISKEKIENFNHSQQRIDLNGEENSNAMNYINECIYILESFVDNDDFIVLQLN